MTKSKYQNKSLLRRQAGKIQISNIKTKSFVIWHLVFVLILNFVLWYLTLAKVCFAEERKPRYISLAPSTTEILFALGLDDEIVGVSQYCNYPEEALKKEKVGTFSDPNIEKILSLDPDIVFCTGLEQAIIVKKLKELKLSVYVSDPKNIDELFSSIQYIGKLTQRQKEAEALINTMQNKIHEVNPKMNSIPQEKRPKVFIKIWDDPLMTVGRNSFIHELIVLAGGINITEDLERPYSYFSPEQLIFRKPDVIILTYMQPLQKQEDYINPDLLLRPGPRIVEGLRELYKKIYKNDYADYKNRLHISPAQAGRD